MDEAYDIEGARSALEALALEVEDGEERRLAMVTKEDGIIGQLSVVSFEGPTTWRLIRENNEQREEFVFTIHGILCQKSLPPVLDRPQTVSRARYLRQSVALMGLATPTFENVILGIHSLYTLFERSFVEGKLQPWKGSSEPSLAFLGDKIIDMSNRYLTSKKDAPNMEHIPFNPLVDPRGILEQLAASGNVHGEDNEVLYFISEVDTSGKRGFKPAPPQMFRVGDIVETQVSLVAVPLKGKKFKMMAILRSIALLDARFTEDAKAKRRMDVQAESRPKKTLKRRIGYGDGGISRRGNMEVDGGGSGIGGDGNIEIAGSGIV